MHLDSNTEKTLHDGVQKIKSKHLVYLHGQFIKIIHPSNRAWTWSLHTVGFHTNPSDIKISFKLVNLFHYIKLFITVFFERFLFQQKVRANSVIEKMVFGPIRILKPLVCRKRVSVECLVNALHYELFKRDINYKIVSKIVSIFLWLAVILNDT